MFLSNNRLSDGFSELDEVLSVARNLGSCRGARLKNTLLARAKAAFIVRLYCRITRNDFLPNIACWHAVAEVARLNRKLIFKANRATSRETVSVCPKDGNDADDDAKMTAP